MSVTIQLPRLRSSGFVPGFLSRGQRALAQVEDWVWHAFLCGVSRSELTRLLVRLTGFVPSPGLLSRVEAQIDMEVKRFKERRLSCGYRYLFLDAAWVKDLVGRSVGRVCVLMAVGVRVDGGKEILGFERARQETASAWRGFLMRLVARGLDPWALHLVISDEHKGLMEAVPEALGDVSHQLCWAHRSRNVVAAVSVTDRPAVVHGLRAIYRAEGLWGASAALLSFQARWRDRYPGVVAKLGSDARHLLACFEVPAEHREYVRTTNPIERVFREVRRWRRGCGAFANPQTCDRLFYKVSRLLNERWYERDIWFERRQKQENRDHTHRSQQHQPSPTPRTHSGGVRGVRDGASNATP
jgi:transposase-like protein